MPEKQPENTATPRQYEALKQAIVDRYEGLSRQLQLIARYATDHPYNMAMNTVAAIAAEVSVQPSSLVRFAQAFGFDGFSDMQQIYRTQLIRSFTNYQERVDTLGTVEGATNENGPLLLDRFVQEGMQTLQRLREEVRPEALDRAVAVLMKARQIFVLAQGRAFPVAYYMAFALTRLERQCVLLDGIGGLQMQRQIADLVTPDDAFISISFRPYTPLVIEITTEKNQAGVPVIVITDSPLSPLAQQATISLEVREDSETIFRSLIAPMCLAQTLVVTLGHHMAETGLETRKPAFAPGRGEGARSRKRKARGSP